MPLDHKIMLHREEEKKQEYKERTFYKKVPAEIKSTFLSRIRAHSGSYRRPLEAEKNMYEGEGAQYQLMNAKSCQRKNMNIREYLQCQRESYHLRFLVAEMKAEMKRMEEISLNEKNRLNLVEKNLEEEDNAFEKLLQETLETFVESVNAAKCETGFRLEKTTQIRKAIAEIEALEAAIVKNKETLDTYLQYKSFLIDASPPEWKEEQEGKEKQEKEAKLNNSGKENGEKTLLPESAEKSFPDKAVHIVVSDSMPPNEDVNGTRDFTDNFIEESDYDEEPGLYFTDPKQFLSILTQLKEDIILYIHSNHEDKAWKLEILQRRQESLNSEIDSLRKNRDTLRAAIANESEKVSDLKLRIEIFSKGDYKAEIQEKVLNIFHLKVKEVHHVCIGTMEADPGTQHLLTNLEDRLNELLDIFQTLPSNQVKAARKIYRKETSLRIQEENVKLAKEQHEKLQIEKASAHTEKRMIGRKLVYRSQPLTTDGTDSSKQPMSSKDQEELAFFFS